jgi:long-chain fatty acid transport protein
MKRALLAALTAAAVAPLASHATVGYFSHGYGLKAKGMGGVGIALPQDAMAPASNPAGLGFVENRIDFGVDWIRPNRSSEVVGNGAGLNGSSNGNGTKDFFIPEFGISRSFGTNMALGLVVYGNGGMNTTYDRSPFTAFGGTSPAGVDLIQLFIAPTIAWKPSPNHSFGLSLNFAYQRFSADGLNSFAGISSDAANLTNRGDDDATGWGLKLGWTGKVTNAVTLGATYQTRTRMSKFDKYKGLIAEQGDFDIPEHYGLGISVQATPKLTLAADIQQINYGKVQAVGNPADCLFTGACRLGQSGGGGWRNTTVYKFGASYAWSKDLVLRAGYLTLRQPIPANQTFVNILAPSVVEDHLTLGGTWSLSPTRELTIGYMHAFRKKIDGSGSIPVGFGGGNANLQMNQNSLGVAFGWKM